MTCQAYQSSDQMICGTCGIQWDVDDADPPKCKNRKVKGVAKQIEKREPAKNPLVLPGIDAVMPLELTASRAFELARIYETQRTFGRDMTQAMQKVYESLIASI